MLVLGWLTALWHRDRIRRPSGSALFDPTRIVTRELRNVAFLTEADWPHFMSIVLWVERVASSSACETWLSRWIETVLRHNRGEDSSGFPSPYWSPEQALALRYGKVAPDDRESFRRHTYTVHSALDMFVRRCCRRAVRGYWRRVSKLTFCDFTPDSASDWFHWHCKKGDTRMALLPLSMSWAQWRRDIGEVSREGLPKVLLDNPDWLLPFALVFPHRVNRRVSALIDSVVGDRAILV